MKNNCKLSPKPLSLQKYTKFNFTYVLNSGILKPIIISPSIRLSKLDIQMH